MSAYIVEDKTINNIVNLAIKFDFDAYINNELVKVFNVSNDFGQMLLNENYRSVNKRYNEKDKPHKFIFKKIDIDEAAAIRSIQCLIYQSCQTNDWESSAAFKNLMDLQVKVLKSHYKNFNDLPWE